MCLPHFMTHSYPRPVSHLSSNSHRTGSPSRGNWLSVCGGSQLGQSVVGHRGGRREAVHQGKNIRSCDLNNLHQKKVIKLIHRSREEKNSMGKFSKNSYMPAFIFYLKNFKVSQHFQRNIL